MIPERIIITIKNNSQLNYYKGLGYKFEIGKEYEINTSDLPNSSHIKLPCTCDYCGAVKIKPYRDYLESISSQGLYSCKDCKSIKTKITNIERYGFISPSCTEEVKEKIKETCKNKFGTTCPLISEEIIEKIKKTNLEKYGVDHYSKTEEYKEKFTNTMNERYGVDHAAQSPEFLKKMQQTMILNYGVTNPLQSPEIKEKWVKTNREKYGVDYPVQSEQVKETIRRNNIVKYGTDSPARVPEVRKKAALTLQKNQTVATSRQQKYIHNLFGGELNGVVSHFNCDIVFREEKIIFEYDGGGHLLSVKLGEETEEEFKRKELIRDKYIKNEGFRIVRIISRKDYLPSDIILLQMLQYARDFFTQNPDRSWLSFDLDNNCIYNAYHKETDTDNILFYDFGKLHKIDNIEVAESIEISQDINDYILEPISVNINNICSIY